MANQETHYGFDEGGDDDQSIVSVRRYSEIHCPIWTANR